MKENVKILRKNTFYKYKYKIAKHIHAMGLYL